METSNETKDTKSPELLTPTSSISPNFFLSKDEVLQYKCEFCGNIPYYSNSLESLCCGHLFCSTCYKTKSSLGENCPFCKISLKVNSPSKIISKILSSYKISCPNGKGCEWQGKWEDLEKHFSECENSFRCCEYKKFGCDFCGNYKQCKEHEDNEVKTHFDKVIEYNETHVIKNDIQVRFDYNEKYKVKVHEHPLLFQKSSTWSCNGYLLKGGCLSPRFDFKTLYRFRCDDCDFDLCPYCMMKYATERITED